VITFVAIYSCSGGRDAELEAALGKAVMSGVLMKVKSVRIEAHEAGEGCILHRSDVCLSEAEAK